jgi:E3 ubiquitin-protein ligase BRE1
VGDLKAKVDELQESLAAESSSRGKLQDTVRVLEKTAAGAPSGGGGKSGFSVEQLELQVNSLRNKVMCNVCNVREKEVMITRCGHTFCKACIDERITSRARQCPSCNDKFAATEVAKIWLT